MPNVVEELFRKGSAAVANALPPLEEYMENPIRQCFLRQALIGFSENTRRASGFSFAGLKKEYDRLRSLEAAAGKTDPSLNLDGHMLGRIAFMDHETRGARPLALLSLLVTHEIEKRNGVFETPRHRMAERALAAINFVNPILDYLRTEDAHLLSVGVHPTDDDARPETVSLSATVDYDLVLKRTVTEEHRERLASAKTLWISGTSLRRTGIIAGIDYERGFEAQVKRMVLDEGGTVRIVMLNPASRKACEYAWLQDHWTDRGTPKQSREDYLSDTRRTFEAFDRIRREIEEEPARRAGRKGTFSLCGLDYMLTYGMDIVNHGLTDAVVFVRQYPLASVTTGEDSNPGEDRPIIRFGHDTPSERYWYNFYVRQFELHEALGHWQQHGGKPDATQPRPMSGRTT